MERLDTIKSYFTQIERMLQTASVQAIVAILYTLEKAYYDKRCIFIMGNGGSAATASHFALDLAKNTIAAKAPRLKVISLTDHVPLITAWSNDASYEKIFTEQLIVLLEPEDVVIGISTSGNSHNVINALCFAKQQGAYTLGLLGADGGAIKNLVDTYILAPGQNIEQEEDFHLMLAHIITRHMRQVIHLYPIKLEERAIAYQTASKGILST